MSASDPAPAARKFNRVTSRALALPHENVDTDQITPARFLRGTSKEGLGEVLFADWRKDEDFVLNLASSKGAEIMVVGDNFGCGSSREHAPWAIYDWGLRALISTSFADIFKNNCMKNGILPVEIGPDIHAQAFAAVAADADAAFTVDLDAKQLTLPDGQVIAFEVNGFARHCLLQGVDQLGYIQSFDDAINRYESERPSSWS